MQNPEEMRAYLLGKKVINLDQEANSTVIAHESSLGPAQRVALKLLNQAIEKNDQETVLKQAARIETFIEKTPAEELQYAYNMCMSALQTEQQIEKFESGAEDYWSMFWSAVSYQKTGDSDTANAMLAEIEAEETMPVGNSLVLSALLACMEEEYDEADAFLQQDETQDVSDCLKNIITKLNAIVMSNGETSDNIIPKFYTDNLFSYKKRIAEEARTKQKTEEEARKKAEDEAKRKAEEDKIRLDALNFCKKHPNCQIVEIAGQVYVDCKENVSIDDEELINGRFPVRFNKVGGTFYCGDCSSLTSLEGAPQEVGGDFWCNYCPSLPSLDGAPKKVSGSFWCNKCHGLTNLEGAPQEIGDGFCCSECKRLTSLNGAPKKVGGDFDCGECKRLTSLNGAPKKVGYNFYCYGCSGLTSLEGAPQEVGKWFCCRDCSSLTSLEGAPKKVGGDFDCHGCKNLYSLEGAPQEIGGGFDCSGCPAESGRWKFLLRRALRRK